MEYNLKKAISALKEEKKVAVVSHYFQVQDVKAVSDFIGDTLAMAEFVADCKTDTIVICGSMYIAETCKIFAPDKRLLIPEEVNYCMLDEMITGLSLSEFRKCLSDVPVLTHINSQAEVKAVSDYCCTTDNILQIVEKIPSDTIIFTPDANIGAWVQSQVDKRIIFWDGYCPIHNRVLIEDIIRLKAVYEDAFVISHPECRLEVTDIADLVCPVNKIEDFVKNIDAKNIILTTEKGMLDYLKKQIPYKNFILASHKLFCKNMTKISPEVLFETIELEENEIILDKEIIKKAKEPIDAMFNLLK